MKKRPLSIIIVSLIYLFEPVGNVVVAAYVNQMPLIGRHGILAHLVWSDWIILALFPAVAWGIYSVRKWGWYMFIGFSALLIGYNLYVYAFLNPYYNFQTIVLFIIIITVITGVFFRRHV